MTPPPAVTHRLQRLVDRQDVEETVHRYGHAIDYGDEEGFADCFLPDGEYVVEQRAGLYGGASTRRVRGHRELVAWAAAHTRAPEAFHKHLVTSLVVDFAEDGSASARSYFVRLDALDGVPFVYAFGRYTDRLVRGADGRWRFASRLVELEARAGAPLVRQD